MLYNSTNAQEELKRKLSLKKTVYIMISKVQKLKNNNDVLKRNEFIKTVEYQ